MTCGQRLMGLLLGMLRNSSKGLNKSFGIAILDSIGGVITLADRCAAELVGTQEQDKEECHLLIFKRQTA